MKRPSGWHKLGLLFCPELTHPKLLSHAANPVAVPLEGDIYRILYSGRDAQNRSSVCAVDVNIAQRCIVKEFSKPLFEHGAPGTYYADGVSVGCHYEASGTRYLLFMGWQNPPDGRWRGDIGRLIVSKDWEMTIDGMHPFLGSDPTDQISLSYPWVSAVGNGYYMWYGSTLSWDAGNGEMAHVINFATSRDGDNWERHGLAVPYEMGYAQAFSRPTVTLDEGGFHMWFSYRGGSGQKYRIGYARSDDGRKWRLALDDAGIDVSPAGWDSEMIEYPFVFDHAGERYMLYNGNGYGKTGIGLAIMKDE